MLQNLNKSKAKKTAEKAIEKVFGKKGLALVKKTGRSYLQMKSRKLANSRREDIARIQQAKPTQIHFGCGYRIMKQWANIDISKSDLLMKDFDQKFALYYPQQENKGTANDYYQLDFTETGIPLPDNSVTAIFHEDFMEHINQRDAIVFLAETLRVLKPGGIHRISTPELVASMKKHSDFKLGKSGVYTNEWNKHVHLNIFTPAYLEEMARLVGYSNVIFTARNESRLKPLPRAYRPGNDRTDAEQIFCDLIK